MDSSAGTLYESLAGFVSSCVPEFGPPIKYAFSRKLATVIWWGALHTAPKGPGGENIRCHEKLAGSVDIDLFSRCAFAESIVMSTFSTSEYRNVCFSCASEAIPSSLAEHMDGPPPVFPPCTCTNLDSKYRVTSVENAGQFMNDARGLWTSTPTVVVRAPQQPEVSVELVTNLFMALDFADEVNVVQELHRVAVQRIAVKMHGPFGTLTGAFSEVPGMLLDSKNVWKSKSEDVPLHGVPAIANAEFDNLGAVESGNVVLGSDDNGPLFVSKGGTCSSSVEAAKRQDRGELRSANNDGDPRNTLAEGKTSVAPLSSRESAELRAIQRRKRNIESAMKCHRRRKEAMDSLRDALRAEKAILLRLRTRELDLRAENTKLRRLRALQQAQGYAG